MELPFVKIGDWEFAQSQVMFGAAATALFLLLLICVLVWRSARRRTRAEAEISKTQSDMRSEIETQVGEMIKAQGELTGRMQTLAEVFGSRQSDLAKTFGERLDGMGHRLGQNMAESGRNTHENLQKLHERLAVIDSAQSTITDLSGQVVALQQILSNKQTRGAFGQGRMEAILSDGLPSNAYVFQATLSNGNRPDCIIRLPNGAPVLVVDAKFPLEGYNRIRTADTPESEKAAAAQFRRDIQKHIKDIRERYFIPGETQDTAFMFVPSESVFAELHENFEDLIQRAYRARVVIVSPSLLMLSIQVVQSVLRDARVREQADIIQHEVIRLMEDVGRLHERVLNLQRHFGQSQKDIDQILISAEKVNNRGGRIEALDLGDAEQAREEMISQSGQAAAAPNPPDTAEDGQSPAPQQPTDPVGGPVAQFARPPSE